MAAGVGCVHGGIAGLCELIDKHAEAIEYDLIRLGLRLRWLGSERLTWRDLLVIVKQAPAGSAVALDLVPASAYGATERLLLVLDLRLRELMWGMGGGKGPRPKLTQLATDKPQGNGQGRWKPKGRTIEEANAALGWL